MKWQELVNLENRYNLHVLVQFKMPDLRNFFFSHKFLGLCWVVFRSRNFVDAKRKYMVCITLGFFLNSASGNGSGTLGSGIWKKTWAGKWD